MRNPATAQERLQDIDQRVPILRALDRFAAASPAINTDSAAMFRAFVMTHEDCAHRTLAVGHLTASACVLDATGEHMLMIHHRKLGRWLQPGGHADGDLDLLGVAQREVLEETGLASDPITREIFDLDRHRIPARKDEPAHWHYDVRYLLRAKPNAQPVGNEETNGAQWVALPRIGELDTDDSVRRLVRRLEDSRLNGGDPA